MKRWAGIFLVLFFFFGIYTTYSQSTAIMEIIDVEGTLVVNWVATPTERVITTTPLPSSTPWIITATPGNIPTQEIFTPTYTHTPQNSPTPTVTPSPTPDADACYGTVEIGGLRIRDAYPSGNIIGTWSAGTRVTIFTLFPVDVNSSRTDEWAEVFGRASDGTFKRGWSASFYNFETFIRIDPSQVCLDLEFPEPNLTLLWHTVPGFNINNTRIANSNLKNNNLGFGYKSYAGMDSCLETLINGGTCIYRHPNIDYPQNIGGSDPRQSAQEYFATHGQPICDLLRTYDKAYWEVVNEPNLGGSQSDAALAIIYWWNDWTDELINVAQSYGCPKLVLLTSGPGHGEPVFYRILKDTLNKAAAFDYLLGEHAYTPYHDGGLCACDEWLACRHQTNESYRQAEGVDINVAITEAARGWGNDPVDVADFVCWLTLVAEDDYVHSVALWLVGYHSTWPLANLDNYVNQIVNQLLTRLF